MHNGISDKALLERFAAGRDEDAFRVLVKRYSGLVFHTARRSLGDPSLAEDVSQRVFVSLAKKAGKVARGSAPLPSWLHHATLLEAKTVRRGESRHARRKEALMNAPADPPEAVDAAWRDALPHLDAAIDSLPESDRHVLLLHFVNELSFPEISRRVGRSSAAVQKQSRRALDKLQQILGRKGVALSLGVLTAGLTTEMAKAAPMVLAPALGGAAAQTTTSFLAVKKTTVAAVSATVLLCGVPLARQQAEIAKLEARLAEATPLGELASRSRSAGTMSVAGVSFLQRLARDLKARTSDVPRYVSAVDHIESLSNDELIALARDVVASKLAFEDQETIIGSVFDPLAKRDSEFALNVLLEQIPEPYRSRSSRVESYLCGIVRDWSLKDRDAALAWFEGHLSVIQSIAPRDSDSEGTRERGARIALAFGFLLDDPDQAIEILRPVPTWVLQQLFWEFGQLKHEEILNNPEGPIRIARELLPEDDSAKLVAGLASSSIFIDDKGLPQFDRFDKLLSFQDLLPGERDAILRRAGSCGTLELDDPRATFQERLLCYRAWLESQGCGNPERLMGEVLGGIVGCGNGNRAERVCDGMLGGDPALRSDELVVGFLTVQKKHSRSAAGRKTIERIASSAGDSARVAKLLEEIRSNDRP